MIRGREEGGERERKEKEETREKGRGGGKKNTGCNRITQIREEGRGIFFKAESSKKRECTGVSTIVAVVIMGTGGEVKVVVERRVRARKSLMTGLSHNHSLQGKR